jgi:hypothetical protein
MPIEPKKNISNSGNNNSSKRFNPSEDSPIVGGGKQSQGKGKPRGGGNPNNPKGKPGRGSYGGTELPNPGVFENPETLIDQSDFESEYSSQGSVANRPTESRSPSEEKSRTITENLKTVHNAYKQSKGDPRQFAANLADEYLHLGQAVGDILFVIWFTLAAVGSLVGFLMVVIGFFLEGLPLLIICNFLLFSPKTVYRLTVFLLAFIPAAGEVVEAVDKAGLGKVNIKVRPVEKVAILGLDLVIGFIILAVITFVTVVFCYTVSGDYKSRIVALATSPGTAVIGEAIRYNSPPELLSFCENITNSTGSTGARGYNSNIPYNPSAGVAQWKTLIEAAAQKTDLDPCIIQAVIEQESGGNPNAASTFYPGGRTGPSYYDLDKREPNTPFEGYYNLDWVGQGHAIGLMQISIYSRTSDGWAPNSNGQPDKVPARNPKLGMMPASYVAKYNLQDYYTVSDLRDPQKNIDVGSVYLRYLIDKNGGNIQAAFANYYGAAGAYDQSVKARVEKCRARANLP